MSRNNNNETITTNLIATTTTTNTTAKEGAEAMDVDLPPSNGDNEATSASSTSSVVSPTAAVPPPVPMYQLMVSLARIKPKVWRLIELSSDYTLSGLHYIIQCCMDWSTDHLYKFGNLSNKELYRANRARLRDVVVCKISDALVKEKDTMQYVYDFGAEWEFTIELVKILPPPPSPTTITTLYPRIVNGKNMYAEYPSEEEDGYEETEVQDNFDIQECQTNLDRLFE